MTLLILFRRKWLLNRPMPQFLYEEVSVRPPSNEQLISIEIYYQRHNGTHHSPVPDKSPWSHAGWSETNCGIDIYLRAKTSIGGYCLFWTYVAHVNDGWWGSVDKGSRNGISSATQENPGGLMDFIYNFESRSFIRLLWIHLPHPRLLLAWWCCWSSDNEPRWRASGVSLSLAMLLRRSAVAWQI